MKQGGFSLSMEPYGSTQPQRTPSLMSARYEPVATAVHVSDGTFKSLGLGPHVTTRLGIVNATGRTLTIITRNGLRYTIPSQILHGPRGIYFREGFEATAQTDVAVNPSDEPFTEELTTAQRLYEGRSLRMTGQVVSNRIQESNVITFLALEKIQEVGGTSYLHSLDIVISVHTHRPHLQHPYSLAGIKQSMRKIEEDDASLRISFYIVDSRKTLGERYINFNGRVFRIPPLHRPDLIDGFYAVHPIPSKAGGVDNEYEVIHLTVEDAAKQYGLWRTPEEAETLGFSKEVLERENLLTKLEQNRRQFDREDLKYERAEQERVLREQTEAQKRFQEDRMAIRRDIVEILKFVSAIVITVTGFCATVLKLKK